MTITAKFALISVIFIDLSLFILYRPLLYRSSLYYVFLFSFFFFFFFSLRNWMNVRVTEMVREWTSLDARMSIRFRRCGPLRIKKQNLHKNLIKILTMISKLFLQLTFHRNSKKKERKRLTSWDNQTSKIKCTLPRREINVRSRGTSLKYEEKRIFNRLVRSLSSVSPVRKARSRRVPSNSRQSRVSYTFYCVGPAPKNLLMCEEDTYFRRNSRPRSSFEIGPKESWIEATDRKTKLSLSPSSCFPSFLFFDFFLRDLSFLLPLERTNILLIIIHRLPFSLSLSLSLS